MAAVDERARNLLYPLVKDDVEFLPLYYGENQYYVLNVTTVLDCIDYERAEYLNFPNGGRIMRFTKYAFDESKIGDTHIFKIVDEKRKAPFVSDQFVECVEENGLTGFTFELLWDRGEGVELGNMFFPDKDRVFKHF